MRESYNIATIAAQMSQFHRNINYSGLVSLLNNQMRFG